MGTCEGLHQHSTAKSLLALQLAACVSSGSRLPDGTSTLQGGVVIITPGTSANTTQLQLLTALGADLSCVEILSYVHESSPESHTSGYRPFSIPEDFTRLSQSIKRVNARLVIFDPFISLLSRESRWTDQRLGHLLADLNQFLIEHNVACLITRNCHAKGGHARPSVLERSDNFETLAASRLLLAPNPLQPDRLLLSHAMSHHLVALTPTLTLQIQSLPENPDLPHVTIPGSHSVTAKDLIAHRPDTLHRRFLSQHLLSLINKTTDPVPVATLYVHSPNSSPFQIQRSLRDLLNMGQIERPTRGFYTPTAANPIFPPDATAAKALTSEPTKQLNSFPATTPPSQSANQLNSFAAITPTTTPANQLNSFTATTPNIEPTSQINSLTANNS